MKKLQNVNDFPTIVINNINFRLKYNTKINKDIGRSLGRSHMPFYFVVLLLGEKPAWWNLLSNLRMNSRFLGTRERSRVEIQTLPVLAGLQRGKKDSIPAPQPVRKDIWPIKWLMWWWNRVNCGTFSSESAFI